MITIQTLTFGLYGLSISYLHEGNKNTTTLDAFATCDELQQLGIIRDFHKDEETGEPIIDYSELAQAVYWCDFVKDFSFTKQLAKQIIECRELFACSTEFLAETL